MMEVSCPYCGANKALGYLCPECGRSGKKVFTIAYRSSCGVFEMDVEGFDRAQEQVAEIVNSGFFLLGIKEKEVRK